MTPFASSPLLTVAVLVSLALLWLTGGLLMAIAAAAMVEIFLRAAEGQKVERRVTVRSDDD